MKYDFAVIGANGIQGKIVTRDLLENGYSVLMCAIEDVGLERLLEYEKSEYVQLDLKKIEKTRKILKKSKCSVVVNCAIDDFNLDVTQACLELGINYIDLGSWEEMTLEQLKLHSQYKAKGIIGITGIGSTPGINNIMLRYIKPQFDTIHTVHLGFSWSSNMPIFVTPFSLDTISREFTTQARIFENGKFVDRWPDECKISYNYRSIGKQKTYYTPHIEHLTFYEYLKDVGVKNIMVCSSFPEHSRQALETLIALGLTKKESIEIEGQEIIPLTVIEEYLRRQPIPKGYTEKEDIWLKVYGKKNGKNKLVEMDAVVGTLPGWEDATCNVDTGMPASILAQMIFKGQIPEYGMFAPEFVIPPEPFFAELGKRKIWVYENGKKINGNGGLSLLKLAETEKAEVKS
ncbi:MAG: saccharopine dehydrogenase C-terminal domain-containing protein [Patescibacteria group bacterium]